MAHRGCVQGITGCTGVAQEMTGGFHTDGNSERVVQLPIILYSNHDLFWFMKNQTENREIFSAK